tara:strand:- start:91 stop:1218 length:1128 start_codon:yes stop_codon:yes gene_type:complete
MTRILLALLLLTTSAYANGVGDIGKIKGSGALERGKEVIIAEKGVAVQMQDTAVTARASMRIDFIDETRVDITAHSRLLIDDFVYDPANDVGSLSIKATLGTVRYASGQIAKKYKQNVKIRTPSATIGVRGTDFVMVVDELGGSMITLLPSCDTAGACFVGEIKVETDAGFVIMNQAFQTTITSHGMKAPSPPLILELDEDTINSLLMLRKRSPYQDEEREEFMRQKRMADFLGIDFLQFDGLDSDALVDSIENIWVTALDENDQMLADMLYDMLDELNKALMALFMDELSLQNRSMLKQEGNVYGYDPKSGITLNKEDPNWVWMRNDYDEGGRIRLKLYQDHGYRLDIKQGDYELYNYRLGNGTDNSINIIQVN